MSRGRVGSVRDAGFGVAAILVATVVSLGVTTGESPPLEPYGGVTAAVLVASSLSLWWWRRAPVMVAWVAVALAVALPIVELVEPGALLRTGADIDGVPWWPPTALFAAYCVTAYAKSRFAAWVPVTALVGAILLAPWTSRSASEVSVRSLAFVFAAMLLGLYLSARRRLVQALLERAERAEREQHLLSEQARAEERARLAGEMHDVITHRVSLMVVQAGALKVTSRDEAVQAAAEDLRAAGCTALEELRDLVGLLRDASGRGGDAMPQPVAVAISEPVSESRAAGVPVELVEEGDESLVSPVVSRTAHRIVQEALTNARKHAPGARVRVQLRYRPDQVHVDVHNTAPSRPIDGMLVAAGSGTGLFGLRQRVELINGTLEAGPDGDGGFRVEAWLPTFVATRRSAAASELESAT
jgi:signal transduction histidine kinase